MSESDKVADLYLRLEWLEKRDRLWRLVTGTQMLLLCGMGVVYVASGTVNAKSDGVLHVRGLVIEDAQGRARILLGSPFPASRDRLRKDATTQAMLFIDEHGHDRLTIGEGLAPQIQGRVDPAFRRIGSTFGVMLHNLEGDERGGYSWLSNGRGVMTLDRPNAEALGAFVDDKSGKAGMVFDYPGEVSPDASAIEITTQGNRGSISLHNDKDQEQAGWAIDHGKVSKTEKPSDKVQ